MLPGTCLALSYKCDKKGAEKLYLPLFGTILTLLHTTSFHESTDAMADSANVVTLTDDNFQEEVLESDVPVLVDFWATWCGPCRQIAPIVEDLADEFEGRAKVGKVDVDNNPQTAQQYGVRSIPTLLFFNDGEVEEQLIGAMGKGPLKKKLAELAGQPA